MAEYRRLISYIYEYEGKTKGKNVGFVKLEARNGMCRLNVNVKKLYMSGKEMGVYLLTGRRELFLGNIFLRNGCGEFRAVVQVSDVEKSGETMDECYGLTIHEKDDSWRSYTTIWEDGVAQAAQLTLESVTSDNVVEKQVEMGKVDRIAPDLPQPQEHVKTPASCSQPVPEEFPGQHPAEEPFRFPEEEPKDSPSPPPLETPGKEPEEVPSVSAEEGQMENAQKSEEQPLRPWHETVWRLGTPMTPQAKLEGQKASWSESAPQQSQDLELKQPEEKAEGASRDSRKEPEIPNFEMGQLEMETRNPEEPLIEKKKKKEEKKPVIHQYREEPMIIGDPEALAKLDAEEEKEKQVPVWEFLSGTYPKIQAFDSEHGCQVLVIKPKDIGLLPRETWIYGNNSFLLHGYYNYRYLIVARLENPKGRPRYILGVPGHYYSNEKYMASMFGFPHFVLSKKQPAKDGRFGYWYTDIHLEEEAAAERAAK